MTSAHRDAETDASTGYYLYLMLPGRIDDTAPAHDGAKDGIFIAPGSLFCIDKNSTLDRAIRINVLPADDSKFSDFLLHKLR